MHQKSTKIIFCYFIINLYFLFFVNSALASSCADQHVNFTGDCILATENCPSDKPTVDNSSATLCDTNYKCCYKAAANSATDLKPTSTENVLLQVPLFDFSRANNLVQYIAKIYEYILIILVPIAIIMIIWGGIQWIIAAGDASKITTAKNQIIQAFVGLFIGLFSYVILSLVGINQLYMPGLEKIVPVIVNNETTDLPCNQNNPTEPRCQPPAQSTSISFPNVFLHSAAAKANVPLLKQTAYTATNFGSCGTIATSGCGITSLTMMLQFLGKQVTVPDVTKMALEMDARDCPVRLPASCKTDTGNLKNNCTCCGGTRWPAFLTVADTSIMNQMKEKYELVNPANYFSRILNAYSLKGEFITDKKQILAYLSAQTPLIVSVAGPPRFTSGGHFIVLTGCDKCSTAIDASGKVINPNVQISVNDPYNENFSITVDELLKNVKSCFYIHK